MARRRDLLALSLIFASITSAAAAPTVEKLTAKLPATQLRLFSLVYVCGTGVVGEVRFNDMPAVRCAGKHLGGSSAEVQGWLLPGENRIDVTLTKMEGTEDEPLLIRLHGLAEPGFPDDKNELLRVSIKKGTPPGARAYVFQLPEKQTPPALLWKKAEVMTTVSDADKKALREFAATWLTAMQKGDAATVRKFVTFGMEERARTTYSDPKEILASIDQMLPEMKKAFATAKLAPTLEYTLVGGGRVVRITRPGGEPPIYAKNADGEAALPVSAAKIDGRWTLIP
jgi:hypothetical protein